MILKKFALFTLIGLTSLPLLAYADITLVNNTDSFGTGKISGTIPSPCSADAGDSGVMKPHSFLNIPQSIIGLYCGLLRCDAHIYATQDCSGNEIIRLAIDPIKGDVVGITNFDKDHYNVSGGGKTITINPVRKNLFERWLNYL